MRKLALFAAFNTLNYMLGFFPFISIFIGYLMLPMMRILVGWKYTFWWFVLGFVYSLPSYMRFSVAGASETQLATSGQFHNPFPPIDLWVPYLSPFVGVISDFVSHMPWWSKLGPLAVVWILLLPRYWKEQLRTARHTLIQIPQLVSWGYFSQADLEEYHGWKKRRKARESLKGLAKWKARLKD